MSMYNVREDDLRGNWTYATDVKAQCMKCPWKTEKKNPDMCRTVVHGIVYNRSIYNRSIKI